MKLHFHVNTDKDSAQRHYRSLMASASARGIEETSADDADAVIALGGDGTILRCIRNHPGKPVLGLNFGSLGYLSSVEERDFDAAISSLAAGRFRVAERTMLAIDGMEGVFALNDIVFVRELSGHAALLSLSVDGHAATKYLADGLIIATPTGSTAYSLSAGGPVLMGNSAAFVITPMNPHALGIRPCVVADTVAINVTMEGRAQAIGVYADGVQVKMMQQGESLILRRSTQRALFIELEGYDPYEVMARKLGWSGAYVQ